MKNSLFINKFILHFYDTMKDLYYLMLFMRNILPVLSCVIVMVSCHSNNNVESVRLEETSEQVSFPVSGHSSMFIKSLSIFTDRQGEKYLTFQSKEYPELYIYRLSDQQPIKTVTYHTEGADGVGAKAAGYLIKDWNEIYLPNLYLPEVSVIDSSGHKLHTIDITGWEKDYMAIPTRSVIGNPMVSHDNCLYGMQTPNPYFRNKASTESPVEICIDLKQNTIHSLPIHYPASIMKNFGKESLGIEQNVSRCFTGDDLVYSFAFDENIYVYSLADEHIRKIKSKSRYIDKLSLPEKLPTDFNLSVKMMCELPFYSHLIYDNYRQLYYRFVFPRSRQEHTDNLGELWQAGRDRFSIMILDKDFQVIGETLFPPNQYRSNLFYIAPEGLYISESHYRNPSFNEDSLVFRLFRIADI